MATWKEWYDKLEPAQKSIFNRRRYQLTLLRKEKKENSREGKLVKALHQIRKQHKVVSKKYPDKVIMTETEFTDWYKSLYEFECRYCGSKGTSVDHIQPMSRGGEHSLKNIQMICATCNMMKRNLNEDVFLRHLKNISAKLSKAGN